MKVKRLAINGAGFEYKGDSIWFMYANGKTHPCVSLTTSQMCEHFLKFNIIQAQIRRHFHRMK